MAFAILLVVSNFLAGAPPHYNASPDKIAAFLNDHHDALVAQAVCAAALIVLWIWFLASFAGMYRDGHQGRLATVMYGAGALAIGLMAVGDAILLAITQLQGTIDAGVAASLYGVSIFFYFKLFWATAALAFATYLGTHRSHVLPEWYGLLSLAGSVVFLIGGLSIRSHGFFSPAGAMGWIAFIVFAAWVFVSSALVVQKHAPAHSMSSVAMSH